VHRVHVKDAQQTTNLAFVRVEVLALTATFKNVKFACASCRYKPM